MEHALSPRTLSELRRPRPYPAVSVLTPTHRREPYRTQDQVRLRNVVAEAKKRLESDPSVTRERRAEVERELDQALAEVDLASAEDGLVIFAAPGEHQVWSLARTVPERVVLSDTFLTRTLVSAQAAERPYWVCSVAADRATLWTGTLDRITEARTGGFPLTRRPQNFDAERREQIGDTPSTFRDEDTRHFLKEVDSALSAVVRRHPRRLYVTGEAGAMSLLDEIGGAAKLAVHIPHGGLAHGTRDAVWQAVGPRITADIRESTDEVMRELVAARGRRAYAAGVDEVWRSAREGRVRLLAVEEDFRMTVRGDEGDHLIPAASGELDAREDIVDEIVEQCLETGADVRFVPDGTLDDAERIAAVLRY
ncbi:chemotaxis protein [Streptomyces sp. NPDC056628]|uniref:baeRF3 domain-containing protein n=1 Tax=Streptomyces sp. NPDC056628 TaxID=3345882 RepID=UPI0036971273